MPQRSINIVAYVCDEGENMSKQIRVSDAMFNELKRMSSEFDADKRSLLNAAIILLRCAVESNALTVEFVNGDNRTSIPIPLVFEKKDLKLVLKGC